MQKVIQSLQLYISHQMRGLSITGFGVLGALGQSGETGPKEGSNSSFCGSGDRNSNSENSAPHFTSNEALLKHKDHLRVEFYLL